MLSILIQITKWNDVMFGNRKIVKFIEFKNKERSFKRCQQV